MEMLTREEVEWINSYHQECRHLLRDRLATEEERQWMDDATSPL